MIRSTRNKTLQMSAEEQAFFERQLVHLTDPVDISQVINRTVCGDLLTALDFLPESFADLVIVDPPYNLTKQFAAQEFKARSDAKYFDYLEEWFPRVVRCLKPSGSLYLCGDWRSTAMLYEVMNRHLTVMNRITWQREKGKGAKHNWKNGMEDIWFGVKNPKNYYFDIDAVKIRRKVLAPYRQDGKPKDWESTDGGNFRMTHPSNFWDDITIPYWSMPENTDHPTQKPEKLIAKLILASCPLDGVVFDPFLGSGTTSVTAKKLHRRYCGVEINTEYACWTEKRLQLADSHPAIQGYVDGIFWERNSCPK
ncbi:MAG: site-specific DNA-methyltransferase [Candidatus Symbiothrix sp.]|nr:site-specific DNA-methyltransferase [Candidatus Symbiothrix sp.]